MEELDSWKSRYGHGSSPLLCRREARRSPGFIVVLNEANQLALVSKVGTEMKANTFGVVVLQPIVKLFVVAKVENPFLKLPFQLPVRLSDEEEPRVLFLYCGDEIDPILGA